MNIHSFSYKELSSPVILFHTSLGMNVHSYPYNAIESNDSNSIPTTFFQFLY